MKEGYRQNKILIDYVIIIFGVFLVRNFMAIIGQMENCNELVNLNTNLWCVMLFSIALLVIKYYKTLFFLLYMDVLFTSMVAAISFGWETQFALYAIALIPISYVMIYTLDLFKHKILSPTVLSLFNIIIVFVCERYAEDTGTWHTLSVESQELLVLVNHIVTSLLIVVFSCFLLYELKLKGEEASERTLELEYLAKYDVNTKLRNRRGAMAEMNELAAINKEFCVAMGDIDDFKKVNDKYGHSMGDDVLQCFSEIFVQVIGDDGIVCRWGGEEFLIVGRMNMGDFLARIYDIQEKIREMTFSSNGERFKVTMTFGAENYDIDKTFEQVINTADERLYYGKHHGKNCVIHENLL